MNGRVNMNDKKIELIISEIIENFTKLKEYIEKMNKKGLYDINKRCEDLIVDCLQIAYKNNNFENVNDKYGIQNVKAIDIVNDNLSVCGQVTSNKRFKKIRATVEQYNKAELNKGKKIVEEYNELYIIILGDKGDYKTKILKEYGKKFDVEKSVFDFNDFFIKLGTKEKTIKQYEYILWYIKYFNEKYIKVETNDDTKIEKILKFILTVKPFLVEDEFYEFEIKQHVKIFIKGFLNKLSKSERQMLFRMIGKRKLVDEKIYVPRDVYNSLPLSYRKKFESLNVILDNKINEYVEVFPATLFNINTDLKTKEGCLSNIPQKMVYLFNSDNETLKKILVDLNFDGIYAKYNALN